MSEESGMKTKVNSLHDHRKDVGIISADKASRIEMIEITLRVEVQRVVYLALQWREL